MKQLIAKFKDRFAKEKFSVGLDIGNAAIKLIKLRFFKETIELCGFALEPSSVDLVPVLKKIMQPHNNIDNVDISVSGPSAIIRYANFPKMTPVELSQSLRFEAQKHIPFSMDDVNLDSWILKPDLPDNKMFVLLAAVKKEFINQRLKLMEDVGIKPYIVDLDSLALINAFNFNYANDENLKNKTIALLNIGALYSNLNILEGGIPCLSRDIHIAGNNFTQKLVDIFGIDFKSAENLKFNPDNERFANVSSAIESVLVNLATEIRTSFDYYESQSASSVVKIFLSGGGSLFPALKDVLANLVGIEVDYWDSLKQINFSDNVDSKGVKALSGQLAVAMGLALRQ